MPGKSKQSKLANQKNFNKKTDLVHVFWVVFFVLNLTSVNWLLQTSKTCTMKAVIEPESCLT